MNSGRILVDGSDLYIGNSSNRLVQLGTKADFDQCFQSVSEGKSLIAGAVTDKGVQTAPDDTFQQIANNIAAIFQLDTSDATALASQILSGCAAYVKGSKVIGTMANRGAVTSALNCGGSYTIPVGYHNGSGKVTANSLASQTSGTATAARILFGYTAWVNGVRLTGTLQAGIPFQSASVDQVGNSGAIYIPENVTKFYFFHGTGLYWSWHRCDDASTSNMVMIASSRGREFNKSSYDPSRRIIVLEVGDEDEGMGVIGWQ